tara:strand:+ start:1649 stop:2077 length:429 start_codon:yes stop_codon:yes gene_type:complete
MNQLQQVFTEIYKPSFDVNKGEFVDATPYKPYERNCVRYECRCRAGAYFVGNALFKQHIKSKTHKDFISNYKKYYKEVDEAGETIISLTAEKELLLRKNKSLMNECRSYTTKITVLQKQNTILLEMIKDLNEDMEFEECHEE